MRHSRGQIDVLPAERREVLEVLRSGFNVLPSQMIDGSLQVRCVSWNDGGHDQVQPARAVALDKG